ncbi:MAG: pilin [bacterium]|nr:pilin [bacterium]
MRRKIFSLLFLVVVLWPVSGVGAAGISDLKPQLNPICWKQADCAAARVKFGKDVTNAGDGWLVEEPCKDGSGKFGKCLPGGITETQIKFGGQSKFKDLGEFFKLNYNYLLGIAGILSTFMIIIGAAQYVTSGGSSEAISSAKKRIAGALVGLLIAYLSYVILTTINPALTNLRLPQVFMLNTQNVVPQFCSGLASGDLMEIPAGTDPDAIKDLGSIKYNIPNSKKGDLTCGHKYIVDGGGTSVCMGDTCGSGVCAPISQADLNSGDIKNKQPSCVPGQVIVEYKFDSSLESLAARFVKNIPLAGIVLEQISNPWLSQSDKDDNWVNSVCRNIKGTSWSPVRQNYSGVKWIKKTYDVGKDHYVTVYADIIGNEADDVLTAFWCAGETNTNLYGFIISNQVDMNYSGSDKFIHLGVDKKGKGVFGKWNMNVNSDNAITINQMRKGLYLLAEINPEIISNVVECPNQDINNCCDGDMKGNYIDKWDTCRDSGGGD